MRPAVDTTNKATPDPRSPRALRVAIAVLGAAVMLTGAHLTTQGPGGLAQVQAAEPIVGDEPAPPVAAAVGLSTTTSSSTSTTTSTTSLATGSQESPALEARYLVPPTEALGSRSGVDSLAQASAPLTHTGSWSRGEVIYPQLGGLRNGRASVMVVTRQTVGSGSETEFSVVRTLDIRLLLGESGWEFDFLSSAGGTFDPLEDLTVAHAVARDPRIEMPDSARLDILSGLVSPTLLTVMAELAEQTPYEVVVLATGHPHNVFETDRQSHHTIGQAVDINRIGDRVVVDDRGTDSATRAIVGWLYDHPDVHQVGSPWDVDGAESGRSFTDAVHQDHIHLAVDNGS